MPSYNRVMLIGNMTRDPQVKFLPNQTAICEFGLAMNRKYKTASGEQREEVCFVDCTCFGKGGEIINQYMTKGRPIMVEGRLKYDTWEDKQGGGKRNKLSVVVEEFQFLGGRDDDASGGGGGAGGGARGRSSGGGNYGNRGGYTMDDDGGGDSGGGAPPARRAPARPARAPQKPAEEAPFDGDEQHFEEDDIPF